MVAYREAVGQVKGCGVCDNKVQDMFKMTFGSRSSRSGAPHVILFYSCFPKVCFTSILLMLYREALNEDVVMTYTFCTWTDAFQCGVINSS
jgi:hypothetical protein